MGAMILFLLWGSFAPALQGQEGARPTEDHLAIAARYRKEAEETREAIKRHQLMIDIYRKGPMVANPQGRQRMVEHCERVVQYFTNAAKELEAMAEEHEAMAREPRSLPEGQK
jgi:hypothetical protein